MPWGWKIIALGPLFLLYTQGLTVTVSYLASRNEDVGQVENDTTQGLGEPVF